LVKFLVVDWIGVVLFVGFVLHAPFAMFFSLPRLSNFLSEEFPFFSLGSGDQFIRPPSPIVAHFTLTVPFRPMPLVFSPRSPPLSS